MDSRRFGMHPLNVSFKYSQQRVCQWKAYMMIMSICLNFWGKHAFCESHEELEIWIRLLELLRKFEGFKEICEAFVPVKCLQSCFHNHVTARFAVSAFSPSQLYLSQSYAGLQLSSSCFGAYIYILSHSLTPPPSGTQVMKKDVKMTSRENEALYLQKIWTVAPTLF